MEAQQQKKKCGCGRSQTGHCTGLHKLTEAEYKEWLQKEAENDQA